MSIARTLSFHFAAVALGLATCGAFADDAAIRRALSERLPDLPRIDEITKSPVQGLYEVRYNGTEILYASENGDYVFVNGSLVETHSRQNLTEARSQAFMVTDFDKLPLKDAIVIRQGNGARRMAMFVDPYCEYCKSFERDLVNVRDVTIYAFMIPILGPESKTRARDIWCAGDPARAWRDWMLRRVEPMRAMKCDVAPLERNVAFASQQRISVTPSLFFGDGSRKKGILTADAVESRLREAAPHATAAR
ncbi:MAG TPA: DsbC family protein [Burkholderiaceae bacterium]